MIETGKIWMNGKLVPFKDAKVHVLTHALHYSTSIFEGIRSYWNGKHLNVFRLDEHVKRFRKSGQFYNISLKGLMHKLLQLFGNETQLPNHKASNNLCI